MIHGMVTVTPDEEVFCHRAAEDVVNIVPVWGEFVADMETPISAFRRLNPPAPSFLLESAEGGERVGRYSFIGFSPLFSAVTHDGLTKVSAVERLGYLEGEFGGNPLETMRRLMGSINPAAPPPLRFYGGAIGYCSYDIVRHLERLPEPPPATYNAPEAWFVATEIVIAFDHLTHKVWVVANTPVGGDEAANREAYRRSVQKIKGIASVLLGFGGAQTQGGQFKPSAGSDMGLDPARDDEPVVRPDRESFINSVHKAKEYIRAGDIFQVVLSVEQERPLRVEPFQLYRSLRALNPSPYLFFLDFGEMQLVGSSPEMLVRVEDGVAETRPIAGTRRRGGSGEEDSALEAEMLASEKERAEHVMLVDLGRNDLGRVSAPGTVHVSDLMRVERYSHVMHMVSDVRGTLREGKDAFDALAACFPAGTLTGAPKVRAMEIIDELEVTRRGPYGGCVGYFGFTGNMDTCITIRTLVVNRGRVFIRAGAGIVADSEPEAEWEECMNKARALVRAVEMAEKGGRGA